MKTFNTPNHESTFQSSGLDNHEIKFFLTDGTFSAKGKEEFPQIIDCARENADKSFYYPKYRNYEYSDTSTHANYMDIRKLIKFQCAKYAIPKNFQDTPARYEIMTDAGFKSFTGIVTHVNCRTDKVDMGPHLIGGRL